MALQLCSVVLPASYVVGLMVRRYGVEDWLQGALGGGGEEGPGLVEDLLTLLVHDGAGHGSWFAEV